MKLNLNHTLRRLVSGIALLALFSLVACSGAPGPAPTALVGVPQPVQPSPTAVLSLSPTPTQPSTPTLEVPASALAASPTPPPATASPTEALAATLAETQAEAVACTSPQVLTVAVTEGPYFKAGSPERSSLLEPGMPGSRLVLTGYVLTAGCKPVAGALLDFWQADANGQYDNAGFTLRGHLFTDANGRYQLETIDPGLYPGRTEHIHVKVQAPGGPVLTTQLFFPEVAGNQSDSIFIPSLLVKIQASGSPVQATFNFIIQ